MDASPDPLVGRVLNGRFTLQECIGHGGMGRVYRAVQVPLGRVVAVKVLSPRFEPSRDPAFRERFALEASLTARLRHPNTVSIIDYGQTSDGIFFIAMELLDGQTLAQLLQRGPLNWERAVAIAQQICRSLREAHRLGLLHRDLKPANVMLLTQGADEDLVKVLDFGLVKPVGISPDAEVTQGNTFLGSPTYMAPEQARRQESARSDIYSLGVVMFHMLAGRPPFVAKEPIDVIVQHLNVPPPWIHEVCPTAHVPPELEAVVRRCLEKDPARRYQSMDEVLDALKRASAAIGFGLSFGPTDPRLTLPEPQIRIDVVGRPEPRRVPLRWVMAGVVASSAALGLAAAMAMRRTEPQPLPAPAAHVETAAVVTAPVRHVEPDRPSLVRFRVSSVPSGATVWMRGQRIGRTPLTFDLPNGPGGAIADLVLTAEGYHPLATTAVGHGPEVVLIQRLQKKEEQPPAPAPFQPPPPPPAPPPQAKVTGELPAPVALAPLPVAEPPRPATDEVVPYTAEMTRPELPDAGRPPVYPSHALAARIEGTVVARCVVRTDGTLQRCRILKSLPYMDGPVLESLATRRYRPATLHGRPVAVDYVFNLRIRLPRG